MSASFVTRHPEKPEQLAGVAGFVSLGIGYLLGVLLADHLTVLVFLAFTAVQLLYCLASWLILRGCLLDRRFALPLYALTFSLLAVASGLLGLAGIQWDWLLYLVTASLYFSLLRLRVALVSGLLLYGAAALNLALLDHWRWSTDLLTNLATIFAAFGFVGVFSLAMALYEAQKQRAERLLQEAEQSRRELEAAHAQLRHYAEQVEELTIARERTRVAREIHDTLGHYLTILNVQLETISQLQERDPSRLPAEIAEARHVAAQSMREVRNAVAALRPAGLALVGLTQALIQLGNEFTRAAEETELTLDLEAELPSLSPDIQVALYRATQEALTNVRKHARASKALVRLRYENEWLELMVLDNGCGAAPVTLEHVEEEESAIQKETGGFGLIGLRERVELLGGEVTHGPAAPAGYRVTVRIRAPATSAGVASGSLIGMQKGETVNGNGAPVNSVNSVNSQRAYTSGWPTTRHLGGQR